MGNLKVTNSQSKFQEDTLRINSNSKHITGKIQAFTFIDRDTKQFIFYLPSLELTSYGENQTKANEMLNDSVDQYFEHLTNMSSNDRNAELKRLGWHKHKFYNKIFSKSFVDINGNLKNFNAVDDKVERITLETA